VRLIVFCANIEAEIANLLRVSGYFIGIDTLILGRVCGGFRNAQDAKRAARIFLKLAGQRATFHTVLDVCDRSAGGPYCPNPCLTPSRSTADRGSQRIEDNAFHPNPKLRVPQSGIEVFRAAFFIPLLHAFAARANPQSSLLAATTPSRGQRRLVAGSATWLHSTSWTGTSCRTLVRPADPHGLRRAGCKLFFDTT